MSTHSERKGDFFAFSAAFLWALFPVLVVFGKNDFSPLFFAAMSFSFAAMFGAVCVFFSPRYSFAFPKKAIVPALLGGGIIMLLVFPLDITAGKYTTAGNIGLLSQAEVFFTFLMFGLLGLEPITKRRSMGAFFVLFGCVFVLLQNFSGTFSLGDLFVILATAVAPVGNYFQKKVVLFLPPVTWMMYRNFFAALLLFPLSFLFEQPNIALAFSAQGVFLFFISGVFAFGLSKWFFFEGIQQIGVAKSMAINASSPAITLLLGWFVLGEYPTWFQYLGLLFIISGLLLVLPRSHTNSFSGKVVRGDGIGTSLGFPTLNIHTKDKLQRGVFAVRIQFSNGNIFSGVLHVGSRPTFKKKEIRVEAHLFQFSEYIPEGEMLSGEVLSRIRGVQKFRNMEDLQQQIQHDILIAKNLLNDLK